MVMPSAFVFERVADAAVGGHQTEVRLTFLAICRI